MEKEIGSLSFLKDGRVKKANGLMEFGLVEKLESKIEAERKVVGAEAQSKEVFFSSILQ